MIFKLKFLIKSKRLETYLKKQKKLEIYINFINLKLLYIFVKVFLKKNFSFERKSRHLACGYSFLMEIVFFIMNIEHPCKVPFLVKEKHQITKDLKLIFK